MRDRAYLVVVAVLAVAVLAGVREFVRTENAASLARLRDAGTAGPEAWPSSTSEPRHRPVAETARLLRELKLVTVDVQTTVESSRLDASWRGDVRASVTAPVRLLYGCDLSGIEGQPGGASAGAMIRPNLLTGGYVLRVPRPERIAAEISGDERAAVDVGWGRFRDLAGEFQLGLARRGLAASARGLVLTPAQREQVERTTREQLTTLVRALAAGGEPVAVDVEFFDTGADQVAGATDQEPGGREERRP